MSPIIQVDHDDDIASGGYCLKPSQPKPQLQAKSSLKSGPRPNRHSNEGSGTDSTHLAKSTVIPSRSSPEQSRDRVGGRQKDEITLKKWQLGASFLPIFALVQHAKTAPQRHSREDWQGSCNETAVWKESGRCHPRAQRFLCEVLLPPRMFGMRVRAVCI